MKAHANSDYAYLVIIPTRRDYETLLWCNERGYDARFYDIADCKDAPEDDEDGPWVFTLTEAQAWEFNDNYDEDPVAFLTCSGARGLNDALYSLLEEIV